MRSELRDIQRKTGVTFIYITHDQGEALTMSDRIAVMKAGIIEQVDTTDLVYDAPSTAFAATFVGANNMFKGKITKLSGDIADIDTKYGLLRGRNPQNLAIGSEAILFVRPEKTHVKTSGKKTDNTVKVQYERRDLEGPFINLHFAQDGDSFSIHQTNVDIRTYQAGDQCTIGFDSQAGLILTAGDRKRVVEGMSVG